MSSPPTLPVPPSPWRRSDRGRPRASLLVLAAALAFGVALWVALPGVAAEAPSGAPRVDPGGLVRWSAPGTAGCAMEGSGPGGSEPWEPLGETCWYPVDLLADPGPIRLTRWVAGERQEARVTVAGYPYRVQRLTIDDPERTDPDAAALERIGRERERVDALFERGGPRLFTLPLVAPVAGRSEGGRFGSRRFINGEPRSPHSGADYAASTGTPVRAAASGVVALAEEHFFAGNSVYLDHGDGLVTMYFHLSRMDVRPGQRVEAGEVIGRVGATGRVTGPHLHFGVRWRGARVDPAQLLDPRRATEIP